MRSRLEPSECAAFVDRRRSPRLDVSDRLQATLPGSDDPVRVLDISFGGCLLETDTPLPVGSLQPLRFSTTDGVTMFTVTARVAHSRRDSVAAKHSRYVSGFTFVAPRGPQAAAEFDRLIDTVMTSLALE